MKTFNYEWWTVTIRFDCGTMDCEYKGKNKENIIRRIKKDFEYTNSKENLNAPWYKRKSQILEIYWETLRLDRIGYQRLS